MLIDWTSFTPWSALAGGALIGLSAGLLFLSLGRIAGISGNKEFTIPKPGWYKSNWQRHYWVEGINQIANLVLIQIRIFGK